MHKMSLNVPLIHFIVPFVTYRCNQGSLMIVLLEYSKLWNHWIKFYILQEYLWADG